MTEPKEERLGLQDFPVGPLDVYRSQATFDWKEMKVFMEGERFLEVKVRMYNFIKNDPDFQLGGTTTLDELRRSTNRRTVKLMNKEVLPAEEFVADRQLGVAQLSPFFQLDPSATLKLCLLFVFYEYAIRALGTERHQHFLDAVAKRKLVGCFALTEVAHGTDTKNMRCRADYDPAARQFVIHTPDFEAAKCWIGNLGQSATHAVVFAQLFTADGVNQGVHGFVVPLRNPRTLLPYPGVLIGDMGEKIGLNGVDNGFLMLNRYRIPRENLLNKLGDVSPDGQYVSTISDPNKRLAASFLSLSVGRVCILTICTINLTNALTIAIRYSAVRRQFGTTPDRESAVIEYQLQQWRLIPYLAALYAFKIFSDYFSVVFEKVSTSKLLGKIIPGVGDLQIETHVLMSAAKPLLSWTSQKGIQECREACGGHGYLKISGLGRLRDDNDANCTYEGENNVLIQQTSNWLLFMAQGMLQGGKIDSPLQSANFINDYQNILGWKWSPTSVEEVTNIDSLIRAYEWLICFLLKETATKYHQNLEKFGNSFTARNEMQVFHAKSLSLAFIERFILLQFLEKTREPGIKDDVKNVLLQLCSLYGVWSLEQYLAVLYQGGFIDEPSVGELIKDAILSLCSSLKKEAVALIDALAPPDYILNSTLGKSDGQLYNNLQNDIFQSPQTFERPSWWQEILPFNNPASKL